MSAKEPIVVFWSGGKDSALALAAIRPSSTVLALLTTLNEDDERSSMHRVRRELLERQAATLGLPIQFIRLPAFPPNSLYEDRVRAALRPFLSQGVRRAVFGDLFLTDIRAWRDELLRPLGMEAVYPLWGRDPAKLARELLQHHFRAALVCVDARRLDAGCVGREFDAAWLHKLPAGIDPCGENGEFHTFVFDGPDFTSGPVAFKRGDVAAQGGFVYQDLVPMS